MRTIIRRKKRRRPKLRYRWPELTVARILAWADAWHASCGAWPTRNCGRIPGTLGEKWQNVDMALRRGSRGLPGGSSLARLLAAERGVRNMHALPRLRIRVILAWCDAWYQRTGSWPKTDDGRIPEAPDETWPCVDAALRDGLRGLKGGSSLPRLLAKYRGVRNDKRLPPYDVEKILAWADAYHARTGRWPTQRSGPIEDAPGETWSAVHQALMHGSRGLPGGSSLAQLLAERRGMRNEKRLPPFRRRQLAAWVRSKRRREGIWPTRASGPILEAPGETWNAVERALRDGHRGLPGGSSLAQFLDTYCGRRRAVERRLSRRRNRT